MQVQQRAAEIAFFKLNGSRSYRFRNLPTTRLLDLKAGQVLRVTDQRDIAYFRARDVVVECNESGHPLNAPAPGTITAPNAKTKRAWRSPNNLQNRAQQVPGTMPVHSQLPNAQNPTAQRASSAFSQQPPGSIQKGPQPQVVGGPSRPTMTTAALAGGGPRGVRPAIPVPTAPPEGAIEVRLGQVAHGGHALPQTPVRVERAPAPEPVTHAPIVEQALDMHPGASAPVEAAPTEPSTPGDAIEVVDVAEVPTEAPQNVPTTVEAEAPQVGLREDGSVDPSYVASPLTPEQIIALQHQQQTPPASAPRIVGGPTVPTPAAVVGSGVSASASLQQAARGMGVPSATGAEQILAEQGMLAPETTSPIEGIGSDGRPAGEY